MVQVNKPKQYALMTATSMGVRITPVDCQPVHTSSLYQMQATSAESNVLSISAVFILPPKWFFVKPYFLEAFELSELGHSRSFSEQTGTFFSVYWFFSSRSGVTEANPSASASLTVSFDGMPATAAL